MELKRCGANRFCGWTNLKSKGAKPNVFWKSNELIIEVSGPSPDSYSTGEYKYRIELTLNDIGDILKKISKDMIK